MQVKQNYARILGRIDQLIDPRSENQRSVHGQRNADEKPDGNHAASLRSPENNV